MPNYFDAIDANQFWTAPESDIFPLPVVAIALGIGRNKMSQIPVARIMIDKRAYYRKSDILEWFEVEQKKGKNSLLLQLRAQNSSIGRAEKSKSQFYDYYFSKSNGSHCRPSSLKGETKQDKFHRLTAEWRDISNQLKNCNGNEELKKLVKLAWEYREQFIKLRMGLHYGLVLNNNWWFEKDFDKLLEARLVARRESLQREIDFQQEFLESKEFIRYASLESNEIGAREYERKLKLEIEQLKAELKELG